MVTRDTIRNLRPGNRLEIQCDSAGDLLSSYMTAYQIRKELGFDKNTMVISMSVTTNKVIIEYKKGVSP